MLMLMLMLMLIRVLESLPAQIDLATDFHRFGEIQIVTGLYWRHVPSNDRVSHSCQRLQRSFPVATALCCCALGV